jgi:hypothetical protein
MSDYSAEFRVIDTKLCCNGLSKPGGTLHSTALKLSSLAATKEAFAENLKRVYYHAIKVLFTGSWQFSAT